jgi:predicted solute-binding protein
MKYVKYATTLPRKQLSEYYSNFQYKILKNPKHLGHFKLKIRIILT